MTGSASSLAASVKSQNRTTDDESSQQKQKHKNLTDRLVFYPSSNNMADYNSSMNLNYMGYTKDGPEPQQPQPQSRQQYYVRQASPGEHRKQQQQQQQQHQETQQQQQQQQMHPQHDEHMRQEDIGDVRAYMRSSSVPARTVYYPEYGEMSEGSNRYIANQQGYVSISSQPMYGKMSYQNDQHSVNDKKDAAMTGNHKYLNKFSQWIPDNLKLKRISKRYRSHSLPAVADTDDDSLMQLPQAGKGMPKFHQDKQHYSGVGKSQKDPNTKSMFTSPIKSGRSFLQRKSLSLSTPLARDENNSSKKKKRSITSTMTNLMQKAKVYRRHSFSHSSLSNEYSKLEDSRQMSYNQSEGAGAAGTSSKFLISKPPSQSYSQSDPESVYSDFLSDNEEKSASDTGDRFAGSDLLNAANMFATMDESAAHQRTERKEPDQGIFNTCTQCTKLNLKRHKNQIFMHFVRESKITLNYLICVPFQIQFCDEEVFFFEMQKSS